jgi:dolichol-phosphate mannosyltransferase
VAFLVRPSPEYHTFEGAHSEKMSSYTVLLPTLNEKENIPIITYLIMKNADEAGIDLDMVIVDDNSGDGT